MRAAAGLLAAALVLLPGALLLSAGEAQAQSSVKLVANTGQSSNSRSPFLNDHAQAFTTGSAAEGYTLTQVDLKLRVFAGSQPSYGVSIRENSSGVPGTNRGTLSGPATASDGTNSYTTSGIPLQPNTTYFVVIDVSGSGSNVVQLQVTDSDAEDSGAAAGWSIADTRRTRGTSSTTWATAHQQRAGQIAIHGSARGSWPPAVAAPTLSRTDGTSLTVTWAAAVGSAVTDYDVRYRRKGDTAWTDHPHSGTALTTTITGLLQGASWEAQVAASNATGPGRWSPTGSGHTGPARFVRAETHAIGRSVSVFFTKDIIPGSAGGGFSARVGGVNRPSLGGSTPVNNGEGVGFLWSHSPTDYVQAGQTVTVSYAKPSGTKLRDADQLEIASFTNKPVTNRVPATVPAAPAAPTVSPVSSSRNLTVSWSAPSAGSSEITVYELRYYLGSSDPSDEDDWVRHYETNGFPDPSTSTSVTLSGLAANVLYRVQVRAKNEAGWGPWSSSGTGTTNAASGTNNAPTRLELGTSDCVEKTANTSFSTFSATLGGLASYSPLLNRDGCDTSGPRAAPVFGDADIGDTLIVAAKVPSLPDNVRPGFSIPFMAADGNLVWFAFAAAYRRTDVRIDLTATDPHGARTDAFFTVSVPHLTDTNGAPSFVANPGPQRFAHNQAIQPLVLPAATGGDVRFMNTHGDFRFPYVYAVDGLPTGLTFDSATRTISGTPTELGTYTVTYTAEDADGTASAGLNPTTVDSSDTASLTFTMQVGNQPGIERVRIVSKPQLDSDGDGTEDTYIRFAPIQIDVEFNEPVKVTGDRLLRLRLDLGTDDTNQGNSRKTVSTYSVLHGGQTLRFEYEVAGHDTNANLRDRDSDGVWVQTNAQDTVVFVPGNATIVHAVTGEAADLTYGYLPTSGDPLHKVDGSKDLPDVGPIATGTARVNAATLELSFTSVLDTSVDTDALKYEFFVRGAGGIGADDRGASQSPQAVSLSGTETVTLTLGTPARAGDTVTVSYLGTTLKETATQGGLRAPKFRGLAVTNDTPGTAGPAPLHASVTGNKLKMVFDAGDDGLDTSSLPSGSAFTVEADDADGDTRDIAGTGTVSIADDRVVTVTLASGMRADELGSVSYEKPSSSPLRSAGSGNPEVQSFDRFRIASAEDGVAPTLRGGTVVETAQSPARSKLALYFDEALSTFSVPAPGDFAVRVGENAVRVSAVAVEDRSVVLTLDRLAASGTLFDVTYTPGTNRIRDWAGNAAAGFRQTVSAAATGALTLQSARVEGAKLVLTYDKPLDPAESPAGSAFILHYELLTTGGLNQQLDGTEDHTSPALVHNDIAGVEVSGRSAVLHLRTPVFPCEPAFELTYRKPSTSPLQGLDGTEADAFASQAVVNGRGYRCNNNDWMHGARVGSVILTARQPFATDVAPQASWFTVTASGGPVTVTGAAYSEDDAHELKLSLSRDLVPGETVTVSYLRPVGELGLWDTDGNQLGDIEDQAVANTVPRAANVQGPALLSVADARASEGADAAVAFPVTLSRAASGVVTVQYLTRDGTAKAGEDYTFTRGTLTFAVGETEKTVSVPILDDALDEGEETFTLKLRNAKGAWIIDGEATGTIENSDPLQKMWLSRFGRTVADHVTAAVSDRLANPLTGAQVTVGGQSVDLAGAQDEALLGQTLTSLALIMGAPEGPGQPADDLGLAPLGSGTLGSGPGQTSWPGTGLGLREPPTLDSAPARSISGRELLLGSAFHLAREGEGGTPGLAAWGRVTVGGFDGEAPADDGNVRIDGEVTTGILGADAEWDRLLAGVAVSVSEGEGTFDLPGVDTGTIESTMTTVSPYARVGLSERVSVWGLAGYGTGDMTIVQNANDATGQPERIARTELSMRLAALGGRGALLTAEESGGFDLALKADSFFVETTSEAISNEGDTTADASRVRLALEGSRAFKMGDGMLTPGLELGLRHDGGDAETGTGVELGGRVSYTDQATGLSVEGNVRALVAHEDSNYREWGASGALRLAPGERGRGLSFSLAPAWGTPSGGVDRLWSARDAQGLAPGGGDFEPESRLEGELGYGLPLFGDRFTGTPNVGFGLSGAGARDYRIGWRLTSAVPGDPGFEVTLDAMRREPANDNGSGSGAGKPEHGVMLRSAIRW